MCCWARCGCAVVCCRGQGRVALCCGGGAASLCCAGVKDATLRWALLPWTVLCCAAPRRGGEGCVQLCNTLKGPHHGCVAHLAALPQRGVPAPPPPRSAAWHRHRSVSHHCPALWDETLHAPPLPSPPHSSASPLPCASRGQCTYRGMYRKYNVEVSGAPCGVLAQYPVSGGGGAARCVLRWSGTSTTSYAATLRWAVRCSGERCAALGHAALCCAAPWSCHHRAPPRTYVLR